MNNTLKETQNEKVYNFIFNKIQSKEWNPGDKVLSENELCKKLNVSRIAVREATEKLAGLGLVNKIKGSGTFISKIDLDSILEKMTLCINLEIKDVEDILKFRLHYEPSYIKDFINNHSPEDIKELETIFAEMEVNKDNETFYHLDYKFHKLIAKGTQNTVTLYVYSFLEQLLLQSHFVINKKVGPSIGLKYHSLILEAIKEKDTKMAKLLMERHIMATIKEIHKYNNFD